MKYKAWWYTMPGWREIVFTSETAIDETELRAAVLTSLQEKGMRLAALPYLFSCRPVEGSE